MSSKPQAVEQGWVMERSTLHMLHLFDKNDNTCVCSWSVDLLHTD